VNSTRFAIVYDKLRGGYWFIPSVMTFVALVVALALYQIDQYVPNDLLYNRLLIIQGSADQARNTLSGIAMTLVGVVGVVFSMTLVALTLASSTFGTFLLRAFLRDTTTQAVLGTYSATIGYCLLQLLFLPHDMRDNMFPQISVTFAVLLLMIDLAMLIYFFHHVSVSLQASTVTALVERELGYVIDNELGATRADKAESSEIIETRRRRIQLEGRAVEAVGSGYICAFDYAGLTQAAVRHGLVFLMTRKTGEFVCAGEPLMLAWPADRTDTASLAHEVNRACVLGDTRTMLQDPLLGISQLVVIASRALSPAVNDPSTAMLCIDRLGQALGKIAAYGERTGCHYDAAKELRVIERGNNFDVFAGAAFNPIRQYGRGTAEVLMRMLAAVRSVALFCRTDAQRQVLLQHARLIVTDSVTGLPSEYDRERVKEAFEETVQAIGRSAIPDNSVST